VRRIVSPKLELSDCRIVLVTVTCLPEHCLFVVSYSAQAVSSVSVFDAGTLDKLPKLHHGVSRAMAAQDFIVCVHNCAL
jgi:hypothetical protein